MLGGLELGLHFSREPVGSNSHDSVVVVRRGSALTLNCSAESAADLGGPHPHISWLRDGVPLSDVKHEVQPNGDLYLRRVTRKVEGAYCCVAQNAAGSIYSRTAQVQTAGKLQLLHVDTSYNVLWKLAGFFEKSSQISSPNDPQNSIQFFFKCLCYDMLS